jgi:pimeloyl-ACP methyl ester carboxylesterase
VLRKMVILVSVVATGYLGLCALLFCFQRSLIYFPQPRSRDDDSSTIALSPADAQVLITTRPHAGSNALVYFGGNAEEVSYNLPSFSTAFPDYAIYLMHYRGYGGSSGKPSEAALFADAIALFDQVHADHDTVTVVGRSLGSGIAIHLASVRPVSRLVLVAPYNSLQELASRQYPYFPVRWLLRDKYESWRYAGQVTAPTLVLAAEHDDVIPRWSTEALCAHFQKGIASLKVLSGAGHNTISESTEYLPLLAGTRSTGLPR